MILEGKRILLGVSGGIAVYKVAHLASRLTQAGALVDVVMTEGATRFVTPLTFQAVTQRAPGQAPVPSPRQPSGRWGLG